MAASADAARAVVLDAGCGALRRRLGALPWVALEVLTARAVEVEGERVAAIGVRGLAFELGVAKDTAARALGVLRAEGLIVLGQRRDGGGHFAEATYVVAASVAVRGCAGIGASARRVVLVCWLWCVGRGSRVGVGCRAAGAVLGGVSPLPRVVLVAVGSGGADKCPAAGEQ